MQLITKKKQIELELLKLTKQCDFKFVAETFPVILKKSRVTKIATPERFQKISKIAVAMVTLGVNYTDEVNKRLLAEGKADDFQAKKTYCIPLVTVNTGMRALADKMLAKLGLTFLDRLSNVLFVYVDDKGNMVDERMYLRIYHGMSANVEASYHYFDAFGVKLTDTEAAMVREEYLPLKSDAKQGGLEDKVVVNNYKLEGVLYLEADKIIINELTDEILDRVAA